MTIHFKTNLRCESCVQKIKPLLDGEAKITHWKVDLKSAEKTLVVEGGSIEPVLVKALLKQVGYDATEVSQQKPIEVSSPSAKTYFPLILIFMYLIGGVSICQIQAGYFDAPSAMNQFMGGFFVVFSFFKILNLQGFSDAYSTYDLIAKRWRIYGYIYPFIELALGIAYWLHASTTLVNAATVLVMGVSSLGVIQSLAHKKKIQCACLGAVFNLPMTYITLIEDLLMVVMAAWMLAY